MIMDEMFSHLAFVRIAVEISPLVMTSMFTLMTNPRCSRKFFSSSSWIQAFSICAWCEEWHRQHAGGLLPVPGDPGEA